MTYAYSPYYLCHYGVKGMKWKHHKYDNFRQDVNIANRVKSSAKEDVEKNKNPMNIRSVRNNEEIMKKLGVRLYGTNRNSISYKTINAGKKIASMLKAFGQKISSVASKTINAGKKLLKNLKSPLGTTYTKTTTSSGALTDTNGKVSKRYSTTRKTKTSVYYDHGAKITVRGAI